ncbi:hypothetical protein QYM36_007676 [Artemia franciscana]|uniref:Uncharacterized protein n=1 Tax=Artemia franciscana TaxID=6661 RepID=A0AA88IHD6_ARTSF|nr:hypothetical protein QYM36_007676 [Artemia franciscana]
MERWKSEAKNSYLMTAYVTRDECVTAYWYNLSERKTVDRSYLRQYPLEEVQETGLQSITLGLQFKVRQKHFKHGGLKIKCLATLAALYWRSDERNAEPAAMRSSYNLQEHKANAKVSPTSEDSRCWFFNIGSGSDCIFQGMAIVTVLNALKSSREIVRKRKFQSPVLKQNAVVEKKQNIVDEEQVNRDIDEYIKKGFKFDDYDKYVKLLHDYNDAKDATQIIFGRLAELDGITAKTMS